MTYFGAMTKISKFINHSNKLYSVIYFGVHYNAQKEVYKKKHEMKVVNILFKNKKTSCPLRVTLSVVSSG
jgi:hypothetical protein